MGRTIDADALKDWLEIVPLTGDGGVDINDLVEHIDSMPAAQSEIIRCAECKHWREDHTCREHSLVSPMMAYEFCSRAERREE